MIIVNMDPQESEKKTFPGNTNGRPKGNNSGKHSRLCIALCVFFNFKPFLVFFTSVTVVISKHGCKIVRVGKMILFCCGDFLAIPLCVFLHTVHVLGLDN